MPLSPISQRKKCTKGKTPVPKPNSKVLRLPAETQSYPGPHVSQLVTTQLIVLASSPTASIHNCLSLHTSSHVITQFADPTPLASITAIRCREVTRAVQALARSSNPSHPPIRKASIYCMHLHACTSAASLEARHNHWTTHLRPPDNARHIVPMICIRLSSVPPFFHASTGTHLEGQD